ncbi:CubicO group peptidase (beta-lactamase class C family) [Parabacteroides sp. PF5-5]|uniref:serine hydrolase domain-containing protein n=1 Tax=unclassified Parabacteroides TaxID=2649774 RepID=UPI0024745454|nr:MULTISPECIES: serine hydrolase [unclassified Parabacteroides]MDH6303761.1 CubicO group peptidase (beta-lactamase class C family) [Parabacteroides sp. PH5-39]MDH6314378.1 CubicO group peptidase (beta-lactamase class C family) [Parabacteroides sp. PF5-13]MDH6318557.1 CubicO group peptidase (beta-lactamase class C family) [Parabacteroides sp. PH5-13]MDH6322150.1 CubicO group peptidase (beta-lactamase class C family) [Parabacteroides sp. PH5-8]MDH6325770.1 CubicO group peptidase (beta-lactamase
MKKLSFIGLILIAVSFAMSVQGQQSFNYQPDYKALKVDASRLDRIDKLLQEYVDQGIIPHALTFVAKDGQVIHNKTFGWRNVEKKIPLQKDDIFRMYSQTKAIATVALMTLFEQGKFQLDDPVSKYIPEMTDQVIEEGEERNSENPKTRKAASPVLIRHLLSHTSGIVGPRRAPGAQVEGFETLGAFVKELVKCPLAFDPGTGWNYHPASDVCGYLVEYFSGKTLQEYVKEVIFDPLGIKDMAYYYDQLYADRFVTIYREKDGKIEPVEMWSGRNPFGKDRRYANAGTGLNGTIEGYARFCQMILNYGTFNGKRILGRRTIEIMAKNQIPHPSNADADFNFGIGFQIYPGGKADWDILPNASPMVSEGSLSWGGMANTDYIIDHKEDMIILLYTNRIPDTLVWEKFLNTVYQVLE